MKNNKNLEKTNFQTKLQKNTSKKKHVFSKSLRANDWYNWVNNVRVIRRRHTAKMKYKGMIKPIEEVK